jgi:hypothetical protein
MRAATPWPGPVPRGELLTPPTPMPDFSRFYAHKGDPPANVAPESHFNEPIEHYDGRAAGQSRLWGDASEDVQEHALEAVVAASALFGLPQRETAHVLAIARVASGLNPDAADPENSRAGLAQFDDATAERLDLTGEARFDLEANAEALVRAFNEAKKVSQRRGGGGREAETMIYKTIHDGPEGDHGGLEISRREVMPLVEQFHAALRGGRSGDGGGGGGGGRGATAQGPMRSGRGGGRGQGESGPGPMRSGNWSNAPAQQREQPARRGGGRRRSGRARSGGGGGGR